MSTHRVDRRVVAKMEEEEPTGEFRGESQPEQRKSGTPRLYIKELVMRNFKSYAGEQRVGPFHKVRGFSFSSLIHFQN